MKQFSGELVRLEKLKTGEYLYKAGDNAVAIYVLVSGKAARMVNVQFDKEIHLGPGKIIGEYSLLSGQVSFRKNWTSDIQFG